MSGGLGMASRRGVPVSGTGLPGLPVLPWARSTRSSTITAGPGAQRCPAGGHQSEDLHAALLLLETPDLKPQLALVEGPL